MWSDCNPLLKSLPTALYRETIGVGTGNLQEWVQGAYKSGYRETIRVGTVTL